jgi:hypothetical protein
MGEDRDVAFHAYVSARSPALLRTAYLLTGDHHLGEDLLQTVLAKTYVGLAAHQGQGRARRVRASGARHDVHVLVAAAVARGAADRRAARAGRTGRPSPTRTTGPTCGRCWRSFRRDSAP